MTSYLMDIVFSREIAVLIVIDLTCTKLYRMIKLSVKVVSIFDFSKCFFFIICSWIFSTLPVTKQVLALSATYPEVLAKFLTLYMNQPSFVRLNPTDPSLLGILIMNILCWNLNSKLLHDFILNFNKISFILSNLLRFALERICVCIKAKNQY